MTPYRTSNHTPFSLRHQLARVIGHAASKNETPETLAVSRASKRGGRNSKEQNGPSPSEPENMFPRVLDEKAHTGATAGERKPIEVERDCTIVPNDPIPTALAGLLTTWGRSQDVRTLRKHLAVLNLLEAV